MAVLPSMLLSTDHVLMRVVGDPEGTRHQTGITHFLTILSTDLYICACHLIVP